MPNAAETHAPHPVKVSEVEHESILESRKLAATLAEKVWESRVRVDAVCFCSRLSGSCWAACCWRHIRLLAGRQIRRDRRRADRARLSDLQCGNARSWASYLKYPTPSKRAEKQATGPIAI
jgi:hypothetical protein